MTIYKELEYTDHIDKVRGVQFGIFGPEEIINRSAVEITTQETFIGNEPVLGGLFDPRMGVIDNGKICKTCEQKNNFCPGHFGHLRLAKPVFYFHFIPMILKILKCCCIRCSQLLFSPENPEIADIINKKKGKNRWTALSAIAAKIKRCGTDNENGCGAEQPEKYTKEGVHKIFAEWKNLDGGENKTLLLNPETIHKIFSRITDEDCETLGFSRHWCRPDWMICSVLSIPPPCVRPSVRQDNNQRMEDDLTHKLIDIIKTNKTIYHKIESNANAQVIDEWTSVLQYHVATLIDNEIPGIAPACQRSGRPLKSIRQRLKSKEGRIRGNLMGKRVDFSARSVITPDPSLGIDELGVPIKIACNLTFPEVVTKFNIDRLYKVVRNGHNKYPGAKSIKKISTKSTISLKHLPTEDIELNIGDTVHRHIVDGDVVLFNRQPSLHRMSMMGHRIKVMKGSTFRLNVSVTSPYNADFDGDEMNMHVPQSIQSQTELLNLALVPHQIISPAQNKPCISIVQDTLLGINRLTRENINIPVKDAMNIFSWNDSFSGIFDNMAKSISGHQLVSTIFPHMNLIIGNKQYDRDRDDESSNNLIKIKKGELLQGLLDKDIFSKTSRGLIHIIYNDFSENEARIFLNNIQFMVNQYLLNTGFSVGISDLIADTKSMDKMKKEISNKKEQVNKVIEYLHLNIFENLTGKSNNAEFESQVNKILNEATKTVGDVGVKSLSANNRMTNMIKAGSKGNAINIAQMVSCLGQQNVDGKRIPYGFTDRTLPHYHKFDDGAESRGFVENSFIHGLNPQEFFFHAMGGREGLIDTAVKTSETGYIQRKLIKAMEDLHVSYDSTVRNAANGIVQFIYGDDGVDAVKVESVIVGHIVESDFNKYKKTFSFENESLLDQTILTTLNSQNASWKDITIDYFTKLIDFRYDLITDIFQLQPDNALYSFIPIHRIIDNAKIYFTTDPNDKTLLNPITIIQRNYELLEKLKINDQHNKLLNIILLHYLSPQYLIKNRISNKGYDYILDQILNKFKNAIVNPGEMVGAISAQSIGEPATQMTLNTFHLAGVSSKSNVTRGVPRLKEILHISKNPKNPSLTVYLDPEISNVSNPKSKELSKEVLDKLELTTIKDIAKSTSIYYDPPLNDLTLIDDDRDLLKLYSLFSDVNIDCQTEDNSPWLLRIVFDRRIMMAKNILMDDIYYVIKNIYHNDVSCIYSDDNSNNLIFRIRITHHSGTSEQNDDIKLLKTLENNIMNKIILRGVDGIHKATMRIEQSASGHFDDENNFISDDYWVIDTDGNNLVNVLSLPEVVSSKTYSNDIYEMYDTFGIEAARKILLDELTNVISYEGAYVNNRHLSLLVDIMTYKGYLMSIDRHGINRSEIGPLAKCSFEETTDQLLKAAIFGESDKVNGISANIMLGQVAPCGTGFSDILLDEERLKELYTPSQKRSQEEKSVTKVKFACDVSNIRFNMNFDNIKPNNNKYIHSIKLIIQD